MCLGNLTYAWGFKVKVSDLGGKKSLLRDVLRKQTVGPGRVQQLVQEGRCTWYGSLNM